MVLLGYYELEALNRTDYQDTASDVCMFLGEEWEYWINYFKMMFLYCYTPQLDEYRNPN